MMDSLNAGKGARVEIDFATLTRLFANRQMQVCELRCLDAESKKLLRRLLLANCVACPRNN